MLRSAWEQALGAPAGEEVPCEPKLLLADNMSVETAHELDAIEPANPAGIVASVYYDAPAGNFDAAEIQKHQIAFAKRTGVRFFQGEGIASYILASEVKPLELIASVGDEVALLGAEGACTITLTEQQMLDVLRTGKVVVKVPETVYVRLAGELPEGACWKDACYALCRSLAEQFAGKAVELVGEQVAALTESQLQDLCLAVRRAGAFACLAAGDSADDAVTFDLSAVVPMAIAPGAFSNIVALDDVIGTHLDGCFIGGRTGGSIEDMRIARDIIAGKRIPLPLRLCIAPATNQVFSQAIDEGIIEDFIDAGAQILNAGTDSCCTTSKGVMGAGEVLFATSIWNEPGCAGDKDSEVYLGSTAAVAASALAGKIVAAPVAEMEA